MAARKSEPPEGRLARLRVLALRLRAEVEGCEGQPFALVQLVAQERAVLAEIDVLVAALPAAPKEKSARDQLAERRAARQADRGSASKSAASAVGSRQP